MTAASPPQPDPTPSPERYRDRRAGGQRLAEELRGFDLHRPAVLALPRGGVPVAAEVARALGGDLDVVVARKVGLPGQPEFGIGAVAEGGEPLLDEGVLARFGLGAGDLVDTVARERAELARRVETYRGGRPLPDLAGRDVVVVDDGLATGVTARAALRALRRHGPGRLLLAVPVGAPESVARLAAEADAVVCPSRPAEFRAVGQWYDDFGQTSDSEVLALLRRAGHGSGSEEAEP